MPRSEFLALFKKCNERRKELFLPPLVFGVSNSITSPAVRATTVRAAPVELRVSHRLQCAIMNYAVDHDGYFPPHPAALIAGKYICGEDLIVSAGRTVAYAGDVSKLTEADWPTIRAEVEASSDFVFTCADLRLPPKGLDRRALEELLVCYSKLVDPDQVRVAYTLEGLESAKTSAFYWRGRWVGSNRQRIKLGLPPLTPDTVHPNPNGVTTAGMVRAGADYAEEVSRRNVEVIARQVVARRSEIPFEPGTLGHLLYEGRISPRHIKDPGTATRGVRWEQLQIFEIQVETPDRLPAVGNWYEGFEEDYCDYRLAGPKEVSLRMAQPIVYSLNTFGGKWRVVGFTDGTARFVAKENLPAGVPKVE